MKTLKSNFGNPMVKLFLKLKSVLDLPQITNEHRARLRTFHRQLKSVITWLNSMADTSAINLKENTTKLITRLPRYLRSKFYRDFKDAKLNNQSLNLTKFKICLGNKVAELFNFISAITSHQEKQKQDFHKDSQKKIIEIPTAPFLHWGKVRRIINRIYYDAGFVPRIIK